MGELPYKIKIKIKKSVRSRKIQATKKEKQRERGGKLTSQYIGFRVLMSHTGGRILRGVIEIYNEELGRRQMKVYEVKNLTPKEKRISIIGERYKSGKGELVMNYEGLVFRFKDTDLVKVTTHQQLIISFQINSKKFHFATSNYHHNSIAKSTIIRNQGF